MSKSKEGLPSESPSSDNVIDFAEHRRGGGGSAISRRVNRLKKLGFRTAQREGRFPATFFWSFFRSEISEIRDEKTRQRALSSIFEDE